MLRRMLEAFELNERADRDVKSCKDCDSQEGPFYRCCDCNIKPALCRRCIKKMHDPQNPFHLVRELNGKSSVRRQLSELGLVVSLGHYKPWGHDDCPNPTQPEKLRIAHTNGIQDCLVAVPLEVCELVLDAACREAGQGHIICLLEMVHSSPVEHYIVGVWVQLEI